MTDTDDQRGRALWEHPALLAALVIAAAVPLLVPAIPPLTDLPGHMARYHVELAIERSPSLGLYYGFDWALIGNLGVDLLIVPMARLFGVELGTKLIVMTIPVLTVAGFLAVAREVHGRIPPTAFFALPLAYSFPVQFGFVNFALATGLCFLAFALWLRLGRTGRLRLRALLFVPLASLVWLCHTYGWGLLGVLAFSAETARYREKGDSWLHAAWRGALACLPLALPFLLMIVWRSGSVQGDTGDWFDWGNKAIWLVSLLREHWQAWDFGGAMLLILLCLMGLLGIDLRIALPLRIAFVLLFLLFLLIPRVLIGSGYADMRMAPVMIAVGLLGIDLKPGARPRLAALVAAAGLAFVAARLTVTTIVFAKLDRVWQHQLAAVPHIVPGSRVLVMAEGPCSGAWANRRVDHVDGLAVVHRDVFTNGMWALPGAQLLQVRYTKGDPFVTDPSHLLRPRVCRGRLPGLDQALAAFPGNFDYLWLIDLPRARWPRAPGLVPVWHGETGILYRTTSEAPGAQSSPGRSSSLAGSGPAPNTH